MFTWDSNGAIIAISNSKLCKGDFIGQMEKVAKFHPDAIILREKDMSPDEYRQIAIKVMDICKKENVVCVLHSFVDIARELECEYIHVPLHVLVDNESIVQEFKCVGVSVHSVDEARTAQNLGASYVTAGHVFATACKKGLPPRGTTFLRQVCENVEIPVFGIGGMSLGKMEEVRKCGANGMCIMSGFMKDDFSGGKL